MMKFSGILCILFGYCMFSSPLLGMDSIIIYKQKLELYEKEKKPEKVFELSMRIAHHYGDVFPDSGLVWCRYAHEIAKQLKSPQLQIEALVHMSQHEFWIHQFDKSVVTAEWADSLLRHYPNDRLHLPLLYRLAEGYEFTTRIHLGMPIFMECYELAEKLQDKKMLARLDIKMGNIQQVNNNILGALEYYKKANKRLDRNQPDETIMYYSTLHEYFDLALKKSRYVSTEEINYICQQVDKEYDVILQKRLLSSFSTPFSDLKIWCQINTEVEAERDSLPLLSIAELELTTTNINKLQARLDLYTQLALYQGNDLQAKKYSDRSWGISSSSINLGMQINSLELRVKVFKELGEYKAALAALEELKVFEKELTEKERLNAIAETEKEILNQERETRIRLLTKNNALLKNRNRLFVACFFIFMILSFTVGLFYVLLKRKNRLNLEQKEEIEEKNKRLEQLNLIKDNIFAIIGHDLRKPAIAFRGITQKINYLLKKQAYDTLNQFGTEIETEAYALNKLTNNLLQWALTQKNVMPFNPSLIPLASFASEVTAFFQRKAEEKGIQFCLDIPEDLLVYADPNALTTIIQNLVDNAIKYSEERDLVEIFAEQSEQGVILKISDTGIGMPESKINSIFLLQKKKSQRGTAGEKGTGLGLYVVHELVELNNGMIEAMSELDKGTTFKLVLPKGIS
ncbi:MAG: HAMP domain-containing histidine kinase [Bacteroidetes bacterium]|nr:HAMP domain-containing histidine kinase [Bacteroidota bacterium]